MNLTILNAGQNYYIKGGSDRYQFFLSQLLTQYGHKVIPFAADRPENYETPWSKYFPPAVNFNSPSAGDLLRFVYSKPAAVAIENLIADVKIDIAHLNIYYGQLTAAILEPLKKAGIPIVQTLHEYKIVCPVYTLLSHGEICQACQGKDFWKATVKRCNRGSLARSLLSTIESYVSVALGSVNKIDHFITVSQFQRQKIIELGIPPEKVSVVHNFIDTEGIEPNYSRGEYFLYFGRLESYKGILTLIEAAAPIKDIPLLIVGDGELRSQLEETIERKNLKHIRLLGFKKQEELDKSIANSICTISPSEWYETFGLTLIESFARGKPVIASKIGGMTEIISDGVDGYSIEPKNSEQLREKMLFLAKNPSFAIEMGRAGRLKVETKFNRQLHYQRIMNVYEKVM